MAIGGADMPVVVSLLNSYSGWAAAAAGFMLSNDLLIVTGALVGSSGTILSIIMCRAMNRSILSVVFGGFGTGDAKPSTASAAITGEVRELKADEVAEALMQARQVVIVPGYGMAVSRAQGAVNELTRSLQERGVTVRFAIHSVAGRLPGHMNVLLAEAGVHYDIVGTCGGSIDQHPLAGQMQHLTFVQVQPDGSVQMFHQPAGVTLPVDFVVRATRDPQSLASLPESP
jgi:NAD(P) transhydrogenase subunit beta